MNNCTGGHPVQHESHRHGDPRARVPGILRGLIAGSGIATTNGTFAGALLQRQRLLPRPGDQQRHAAQGGLADRDDPGNDRGDGRDERGLPLAGLLGLHRLRHAARAEFPPAGLQRRARVERRVADRSGHLRPRHLAHARSDADRQHRSPAVRGHLLRPVRLLLAERAGLPPPRPRTTTTGTSTTTFTVTIPPVYARQPVRLRPCHGPVGDGDLGGRRHRREPGFIPAGLTVVVPVQGPGPVGITLVDPNQPYDPVTNPLVPIVSRQHDGIEHRRPDRADHSRRAS